MIHPLRTALLAVCLISPPSLAALTDNNDGTVTDTATALMWDKCAWGQAWIGVGNTCSDADDASALDWAAALGTSIIANQAGGGAGHRGYTDWRLPSKNELESLVKIDAFDPAIDPVAFPNVPSYWFWSATTLGLAPAAAWSVAFDDGYVGVSLKSSPYPVRLVRGGQSFDLLGPPAPADGQCGTANGVATLVAPPGAELCSVGAASLVISSNGAHSWQCAGSGGGAVAQCAAPGAVAPGGGVGSVAMVLAGGAGCTVESAVLVVPSAGGPGGVTMPYGAIDFALAGCVGPSATVMVTFAGPVADMHYWKYIGGAWKMMPGVTLTGNTATFTIEDNGEFDADPAIGRISDPSGPGFSDNGVAPIPALSQWAAIGLAGLLGVFTWGAWRRRQGG